MGHGEGADGKIFVVKKDTWFQVYKMNGHGRLFAVQHNAKNQFVNAIQSGFATVDWERLGTPPQNKGGKKPRQSQNVVQVPVRDQDAVQALEADTTAQYLSLR